MKRVWVRVPVERAEEARAAWLERFPSGFEERELGDELELAAYVEHAPPDLHADEVEAGWEERWRAFHRPVRAGPFWIGPPWARPRGDAEAIVIDPGRAFGTGAHATTRLCLELLAELPPGRFLDVGCGSGVIAIAAARRGFTPVTAVDVDEAAVDATRRNAAVNCVAVDALLLDATSDSLPPVDVAGVNVSLEIVEAVLPRLDAGLVIASGYLERDVPSAHGYRRLRRRLRDGWAADLLKRAQ